MKTYTFHAQQRTGKVGEDILDSYLRRCFECHEANRHQQNCGIDRIVWIGREGKSFYIEYKTDWKADGSGFAFIETISSDAGKGKEGWASKSKADILIYYLPMSGRIFVVPMFRLRAKLPDWKNRLKTRTAQNPKYRTHGVLVPLEELAAIAEMAQITPRTLAAGATI